MAAAALWMNRHDVVAGGRSTCAGPGASLSSMDWGTLGAMAAIVFGALGLQSFWIARGFDAIDARFDRVDARIDRIDTRLDCIETAVVGLDRRVTRLEERR
jgi:hypothetical protein